MHALARIISFVIIGVLLSFFGKVSKQDLHAVYTQKISDVKVRNSQHITVGFVLQVAEQSLRPFVAGIAALAGSAFFMLPRRAVTGTFRLPDVFFRPFDALHLFLACRFSQAP